MSMTTIKVEREVRDRLAEVARARGTTMGALLAVESARLRDEQRWADIDAAYARLQRDDADGWREYTAELDAWEAGTTDGDPAAEPEWPELNN